MSNANVKAIHARTDQFGATELAIEFSNGRCHTIKVSPFTNALDFADTLAAMARRITLDPALNQLPAKR